MGIAAIALIIGFGILLAREYEEGVLLTLFCAAMNYIAIPLIILFLENIIPLLILIVVGIIIGFVIGLGESGGHQEFLFGCGTLKISLQTENHLNR